MNLDLLRLAAGAAGLVPLAVVAWFSVKNLAQARLLNRWRHKSLDDLADCAAALRGEVRVAAPLRVEGIGDCLWHRKVVLIARDSESWTREPDVIRMGRFSIVVEGRDYYIPDLPTEVAGARISSMDVGNHRRIRTEWIPVVDHLTVVGRFRRSGARWEIVKDPVAGLLFSQHPPARMALNETVKGWLGLAVVAAGLVGLVWLFVTFRR